MTESNLKRCNNILVVDDNPMNIHLLVSMLKDEGYKVWPAPNGVRALAVLQKHSIDLILLDIRMPDMDGYAVCEQVKSNVLTRDIPVIFISALGETVDKLKAFSTGGVDYITKPFEEKEVLARIRTQLNLVEQQERLRKLADVTFEGILLHCKGEIVEVNQTMADMSGRAKEELIGTSAFDLLTPASKEIANDYMQEGAEYPIELQAVRQDGTVFPVDLRTRNIIWQGREARVVAVRDMSWRVFFKQERRTISKLLEGSNQFGELIGKTEVMKKVFESILRTAASDAPVLITGETGTGKELTARTIYSMSDQHNANFVPVNCASIPEDLFESLFFGHMKGSFTGANNNHIGFFEQAQGGTLFLDEVGELSLQMQAKLLRVLNDFTYTPVGARSTKKADLRLIAATNQDLRTLMDQKKVRSDFFHRLYVLNIDLPPLRWRRKDIPSLIAHFLLNNANPKYQSTKIPSEIMDRFFHYSWPGNVRELFNEIKRFLAIGEVNLAGQVPTELDAKENGPSIQDNIPLDKAIEEFEKFFIPRTLKFYDGHKGKTAETLQIDRKTLYRKLKKFNLV